MRSYQLQISSGALEFQWTDDFLLQKIGWNEARGSQKNQSNEISSFWKSWIQSFRAFFERGRPLGEIPWDRLDRETWTGFQCEVYRTISLVPFGETRTYAWAAERIGKNTAYRAVGQALRKNPLPVLIPCHRIVSSDGSFGGFMGKKDLDQPELKLKRKLIGLEYTYRNPVFPFLEGPGVEFETSPLAV